MRLVGELDDDVPCPRAVRRSVRTSARVVRVEPGRDVLSHANVVSRRRVLVPYNVDQAPFTHPPTLSRREASRAQANASLRAKARGENVRAVRVREQGNDRADFRGVLIRRCTVCKQPNWIRIIDCTLNGGDKVLVPFARACHGRILSRKRTPGDKRGAFIAGRFIRAWAW